MVKGFFKLGMMVNAFKDKDGKVLRDGDLLRWGYTDEGYIYTIRRGRVK